MTTITSALISQLRREYGDEPKSVRVGRQGNGSINLLNVGKFPVMEGSYAVFVSGVAKTDVSDYTFDLDNGDIRLVNTPGNGIEVRSEHKYAYWRDKNWTEAIGQAIDTLNARGFFRQVVRSNALTISANVNVYTAPSGCIDLYEFLVSDNYTVSGRFKKPYVNWSYQQDANKLVLGNIPTTKNFAKISYLRNLTKPSATTMAIDALDDWNELIKKKSGSIFYRALAGKIAKQGNATVDEGHFSFTNLRTMANDLDNDFDKLVKSKKPTRPAKDFGFNIDTGGNA